MSTNITKVDVGELPRAIASISFPKYDMVDVNHLHEVILFLAQC